MDRILQIEAGDLHAEETGRRVTGLLVPYGEVGRTNLGRVSIAPDAIDIPADPMVVTYNTGHQRNQPVGRAVELHASAEGVTATLEVAKTPEGDELLAEIREGGDGARKRLSGEFADIVIRAGEIVSGRLYGAAAVVAGAFPSASLLAEDVGPDDNEPGTEPVEPKEKDMKAARVPAGGAGARTSKKDPAQPETAEDLFASLAQAFAGGSPDMGLLAALDQGVQADISPSGAPAWLGEVWNMRTHRQKYVPLFTSAPLNSLTGVGWKFAETTSTGDADGTLATPTVDTYSGYPNEPTSSEVKTEAVQWTADRIAGANEFDRAFVDFQYPDFWRGFYREVANDASRKLDAAALSHLLNAAHYITLTDPETVDGTTPENKVALSLIVSGIQAIQDRATPTYALVGADLWRPLVMTERQNAVEYLSVALGLDPDEGVLEQFKILPTNAAGLQGKVQVGAREAHTLYGPKTVRASTISIANGGVQEGLFAYHKEFTGDQYSKIVVSPTSA